MLACGHRMRVEVEEGGGGGGGDWKYQRFAVCPSIHVSNQSLPTDLSRSPFGLVLGMTLLVLEDEGLLEGWDVVAGRRTSPGRSVVEGEGERVGDFAMFERRGMGSGGAGVSGGGEGSGGEGGAGSNDQRMRDGTRTETGIGDAWVSDSRSGKICVGGGGAGDGDRDWTDTRWTFSHPAALPDCPPKIDEGVSVPAFISPS